MRRLIQIESLEAAGLGGPPLFDDFHFVPRYSFSDQRQAAALPPAGKDFYEITLFRDYRAGLLETDETSPAVCFVPPGAVFSPLRQLPSVGFSVYFKEGFLSMTREDIDGQFPRFAAGADPVLRLTIGDFDDLQRVAELLLLECRNTPGAQMRAVIQAGLRILLHKCNGVAERGQKQPEAQSKAISLTRRFQQLVQLHYLTHRSVADYAGLLGVTPGHLNDSVKDTIGKNAGSVIVAKMMEEAKKLLAFSTADVVKISQDLGFSNPSHFGKFFKKATGETPLEFRRRENSVK